MDTDVEEIIESDPFQDISPYPEEKKTKPNKNKNKVVVKLECDDCGAIFRSKCKLQVHWRKEHLQQQLICPNCRRTHKTYKAFNNHMQKRAGMCINTAKVRVEGEGKSRIFYCKECDTTSKKIQAISTHVLIHTGERPYECKMCDKAYTQMSSLQAHMEYSHKQYVKEVTCEHCGKILKGRHSWSKHLRVHKIEKFPCPICNKYYASKDILKAHQKRHSGVKNYACDICAKTFYISSDLRNHKVKVHFKTHMYCCVQSEYKSCNCLASQQLDLAVKNVEYNCPSFVRNGQNVSEPQKKLFEKNLQCPHCDKTFFPKKSKASHVCCRINLHANIINESKEGSQGNLKQCK